MKSYNHLYIGGRRVSGVAFDLEGTVLNLEPQHFAAHVKVAEFLGLGLDLDDPQTFLDIPHFIGGPGTEIMGELYALAKKRGTLRTDITPELLLSLDGKYYDTLLTALSPEDFRPRLGFLSVFKQIQEFGIPTAIGSLTARKYAQFLLEKSGLIKLFNTERIILAEDVNELKPDPEVYLITAKRMGILPQEQLVFEDSHHGIRAAILAGSLAIGIPAVSSREITDRLYREGATIVFDEWTGINLTALTNIEGQPSLLER